MVKKLLIIFLLLLSNSSFATEFNSKEDALHHCLKIHDEINTPMFIQNRIRELMRDSCAYSKDEDGLYYVSAGSKYNLYEIGDINIDEKTDYVISIGSSGNGGSTFYLMTSKQDTDFDEFKLGMTQGLFFNKKSKEFIYSTHGSVCDQAGAIPCFYSSVFMDNSISKPELIKDYEEKYGLPWKSKDSNLISMD